MPRYNPRAFYQTILLLICPMAYLIRGFASRSLILEELNEGEGGRRTTNHGFLESQNGRVPSLDSLCSTTFSHPQHHCIALSHLFPYPCFRIIILSFYIFIFFAHPRQLESLIFYLFCSLLDLILCICILSALHSAPRQYHMISFLLDCNMWWTKGRHK